jgi:RimJ/RimL family protein N-acetyltransferase
VVVDADNIAINVGFIIFSRILESGICQRRIGRCHQTLTQLGINLFRATITVGHTASARVLEKAGFVRSRIIPDNDTIRGLKCDDIEYLLCTPTCA